MKTVIRERPILFSGPMVRAILDGRKTQTRRIIKPQPANKPAPCHYSKTGWAESYGDGDGCQCSKVVRFPGYWPGTQLWVRETFQRYRAFGADEQPNAPILYRADIDHCGQCPCRLKGEVVFVNPRGPWKPSIFMTRDASRITLEITDVRVQPLQEISEEDAIAEGAQFAGFPASLTNVGAFAKLWEQINGKDSWAANPWLWAITFKRITP